MLHGGRREHVYDKVQLELIEAEEARRKAAPRSPLEFDFASLSLPYRSREMMRTLARASTTDTRATAARRRDGLVTAHQVAQQQVQDYEAELRRLQVEHSEVVRPDARLWWGVGIVVIMAAVGVALPLWVMAQGPRDLASVRWLFWVFVAALASLLAYIVAYLVQLTRRKQPGDPATTIAENGAFSALTSAASCGNGHAARDHSGCLSAVSPANRPLTGVRRVVLPASLVSAMEAVELHGPTCFCK